MSNRKANLNLSNVGKRKQKRNVVESQPNKSLKLEENPEDDSMLNQPMEENPEDDSSLNQPINNNENRLEDAQDDSDENSNVNAANNELPGIGDLEPLQNPTVPKPLVEDVSDLASNKASETVDPEPAQEDVAPKSPIKDNEKIETDNSIEKANDELPKTNDPEPSQNDELEKNIKELCSEYYLGGYCNRNDDNDQFYAKDFEGNEQYYLNDLGNFTYAVKTINVNNKEQLVEYPITLKNGDRKLIYRNGIPIYPENLHTGDLKFPKDPVTNEEIYLPNSDGTVNYPTNRFGMEFYRKDLEGNEVPLNGQYIKTSNDYTELYPKDKEGNQFYIRNNEINSDIAAKRNSGNGMEPYYARKANGDEFYPRHYKSIE